MAAMREVTSSCGSCGKEFSYRKFQRQGGRKRLYCDECVSSYKGGNSAGKRRWTMSMSPEDWALLEEIQVKLGVGVSEALRTSIRVYSAILKR